MPLFEALPPKEKIPCTASGVWGEDVPIPTLPLLNTLKSVVVAVPAVDEPIANTVDGGSEA